MKINKKRFIKATSLSIAISTLFVSAFATADMLDGASSSTPTVKGWAPYISSVGAVYVGVTKQERLAGPQVGDIIEVPTNKLVADYNDFYTFADGNGVQDGDKDNRTRVRSDQYLGQKVSVKWYSVVAKEGKDFVDPEDIPADFGTSDLYVNNWDDVIATEIAEENMDFLPGRKSVSLTVPPEAAGQRVGFIIVAESETGDPFRGAPLKVPDLNFFWNQQPPTGPGDVCETGPVDPANPEDCEETPIVPPTEPPTDPNPEGPGGPVTLSDYIVRIKHIEDDAGVKNPTSDPVVGSAEHPYPLVNESYYAEIKILTPEGRAKIDAKETLTIADYRELNSTEILTVKWHMSADVLDESGAKIDTGSTNPDTGDTVYQTNDLVMQWDGTANDRFIDAYTIKTQVSNEEAQTYWAPAEVAKFQEKSEQRMALKVSFKYDPDISISNE